MNRASRTAALVAGCLFLVASSARSQSAPQAAGGDPLRAPVADATSTWQRALADEPSLVSLGPPPDLSGAGDVLADLLKARLLVLGKKIFSNREWRAYWEQQQQLATALAGLLEGLADSGSGPQVEGLRAWATMAADKMANQDIYLRAIGTERDAVEERRQAALDSVAAASPATAAAAVVSGSPNPYQRWQQELRELQERIDFQRAWRTAADLELRLLERQAESIQMLDGAQRKDVELAHREYEIAAAQARSRDRTWATTWRPVAVAARAKASKIEEELTLGRQRRHSLEVEIELAKSQIAYRDGKIAAFSRQLDAARGFRTLAGATWETVAEFARTRLWRLVIVLILIYIGLRVLLRVIDAGKRAFVHAVGDQDDTVISAAEKRANTITAVFVPVAKVAAYAIALLITMEQVGIDTSPLLGSVAILGLAISFGSQNLVRDLVNGFFILVENQFGVGDVVEICGHGGVVENVNVRSTRIRGLDGTLRIIPNGEITSVANLTRDWSRVVCDVGVGYDSDIERVAQIVNDIGAAMVSEPEWQHKLLEAPSFIGVTELADSAVVFRCMVKTAPGEQWGAERELNRRLLAAFAKAGIEIPFPQRVVWHKSEAG